MYFHFLFILKVIFRRNFPFSSLFPGFTFDFGYCSTFIYVNLFVLCILLFGIIQTVVYCFQIKFLWIFPCLLIVAQHKRLIYSSCCPFCFIIYQLFDQKTRRVLSKHSKSPTLLNNYSIAAIQTLLALLLFHHCLPLIRGVSAKKIYPNYWKPLTYC